MSTKPGDLSPSIEQSILDVVGAKSIPAMPGPAKKAFSISVDPNAEAKDFIEVFSSDEALASRIIKVANSVYFERGKKSSSIQEAVAVIGINELRSFVNVISLNDIFPSSSPWRSLLWNHDLACGILAKHFASMLSPSSAETVFLAD